MIGKIIKFLLAHKYFVVLQILIIPTYVFLLRPGFFPMHDDMQAMRLLQMHKCVLDGQIPCRWVPDMGFGYGYPQFNFYSPSPYYFMEIFNLAGLSILASVRVYMASVFIASAGGMYLLGKKLWGKWGGVISGIAYAYSPYLAVNIFVRGAVGEATAMAVFPFLLLSAIKLIKSERYGEVFFAVTLSLLLTSHNISSLIFLPFLGAFVALYMLLNFKAKARFPALVVAGFWGLSLSAFFTLPAFFEKKFAHVETLTVGYFNYLAHFAGIEQLLFQTRWGFGSSQIGATDDISLSVGVLIWTLPLMAIILLLSRKKGTGVVLPGIFLLLGWISLFFVHPRSQPLWDSIEIMSFIQFPWRFLSLSTFLFSLAAGALGLIVKKAQRGVILLTVLFGVFALFYGAFHGPSKWIQINDEQKFSGELWEAQQTISIFDYLPIFAKFPPASRAPEVPLVLSGEAEVFNGQKGTNWQKWEINVESEGATIQLSQFDFPGWEVWENGQKLKTSHDNELGLITFELGEGKHMIETKLKNTRVRNIGNISTLAGLIAIPAYVYKKKNK